MRADVLATFRTLVETMAREHRIFVSDRKVVKLYKLLRAKAWLERSGEVLRSDLGLMAYLGNTLEQLAVLRHRIPQYLGS
jgi:MoxR-like ATPase